MVYTEEGDLLRITEAELLQFGLYKGMDLPAELVETLAASAKKSERRSYAARLVSGRMLSQKEVRDKLMRHSADADEAAETSQWLTEIGAVDDAAYAGVIVRHYAAMGYGRGKIEQEFFRRGIAKDLWENALSELPDPADSIRRFIRGKLRDKPLDPVMSKKLSASLLRRGFQWKDIRPVLNELGQEIEE